MTGKGQRIGYVRVSSHDQKVGRQLDGIPLDRTFIDRASGKDTNRPQLQEMLAYVREGDLVVVHSMDRLARNVRDLRELVDALTDRGVRVEFVKEHLIFTAEASPMGDLMLSVLGSIAQFERTILRERQLEGIALAKKRGAYRGRKKSLSPEQVAEVRRRIDAREKKATLAREFGVSRETLYQSLRREPTEQDATKPQEGE